jgi:NHLM bacteriocin system ABC transporter ATP-binding protein
MLNSVNQINLPGTSVEVKANQPIALSEPTLLWIVQSGAVAIFSVEVQQGEAQGRRHYLFSVQPGQALFGMAPSETTAYQLLAVPIEETELLQVQQAALGRSLSPGKTDLISLVETWVQHLSQAVAWPNEAGYGNEFEAGWATAQTPQARVEVPTGETFQPRDEVVQWVQVQQGQFTWLGVDSLPLSPSTPLLPLSPHLWLRATEDSQLELHRATDVQDGDILLTGLHTLHAQLLQGIALNEARTAAEMQQQFQQKESLNRQITEAALDELATLVKPRKTFIPLEGKPLLAAVGAVGHALGVEIRPPARSEDFNRLKDPLEAIARASRLRYRRVLLRDNWWKKNGGPLLAYLKQDHKPVALLPVKATHYDLLDPETRSRTRVDAQVDATLSPEAITFYRPLPETVQNATSIIAFAAKGRFWDLATILIMGILGSLLGMVVPQATGILVDAAIPSSDRGLVLQLGLGLVSAAFGSAVFQLSQSLASMRSETASDSATQAAVWDRLLNLRISFFRQYSTGDLQSRVTGISQIRQQLSTTTLRTVFSSFFSLLNLGLLIYYSFKLAIVAIVVALISLIVTVIAGILMLRKQRPLLELQGTILGTMVQLINGITKLRVAGAEDRAFAYWSKKYSQQAKLELSTQFIEDVMALFNTVMPTITLAVLFWFVVGMLTDPKAEGGGFSTGTFLAFNSAFGTFIGGTTSLSGTVLNILSIIPLWKRAQPILEAVPEVGQDKADPGRLSGKVEIDHVVFRYRPDGPLTLDDVSIRAYPGEFIALVGPSGSGKSTIFRLLLGFDTPELGTVYYDGQDLAGLDVYAIRRQIGVVLQNARINTASLFDNIASGAQVSMDEAWAAARMAGFEEDIRSMQMGMHTVISEGGTNLSGGQRQRLIIARALVLKPNILLFDEATSALDNRTQAIVSASLDRLNVTRIVIAHRLSTIRNADRIYVLEAGRVVQAGNFETLAAQSDGLFAQLIARQTT